MCKACNGTGSLSKSFDGFYDCIFCNVAIERTRLEEWMRAQRINVDPFDAWRLFQHGVFVKADALKAAA